MSLKGQYNPIKEEPKILSYWLKKQFYKPEYDPNRDKVIDIKQRFNRTNKRYCIIIPPPNAYGKPHMGNVSAFTYEDLYLRYHRQQGYITYGQPGKDHAGIQGEIVVLREHFAKHGKGKHNMTRDEFYKETYKYFQEQMQNIRNVEKRIGLSVDFDRDTFTLDPDIVKIVLETFIKLWKDGYVYKGVRIVNWCPHCKTALADIDTEKKERNTNFVYIRYPLLDSNQRVWELSFYNKDTIVAMNKGIKTIETRALNPDEPHRFFGDIKPGDIIIAVDKNKNSHRARYPFIVKRVAIYKNLEELYKNEDPAKISTKGVASDFETFKRNYSKMAPDYLARIEKNGIIAVELESYNPNKHSTQFITVATTRPETMLGDTAVVVNPEDGRYKDLIGRKVLLPLVWREIPIISDPRVDKELGTGALKLTPAHAPEDYEIMLTWNSQHPNTPIDYINVIDKNAQLVGPVGKYYGVKVQDAKEQVIKDLKTLDLIEKIEEKTQFIRVCERCKTPIEPLMSSQWFIKIEGLKKPAIKVVEEGQIKIYPENMKRKYLYWMHNLRDWPISRSLWWGYRFPVWYKEPPKEFIDETGKVVTQIGNVTVNSIQEAVDKGLAKISIEKPEGTWVQDDNVFDTWFSSGQWPFATLMKWGLFDYFYPTDLMETGYDILEWWVSRMIMLGLYRTGKIPFRDVYLHGLILAEDGQKMSKSKGNVIYPEEIVSEYGADALRLFYLTGAKAGAGQPIQREKLEGNRRFLNKLWNIAKFVLMNIKDIKDKLPDLEPSALSLTQADTDMLTHLKDIKTNVEHGIKNYTFGAALINLRKSVWHQFADTYIEQVKPRLYSGKATQENRLAAQYTLYTVLRGYLIILHPFIPFITERIWKELPKRLDDHESLMFIPWNTIP